MLMHYLAGGIGHQYLWEWEHCLKEVFVPEEAEVDDDPQDDKGDPQDNGGGAPDEDMEVDDEEIGGTGEEGSDEEESASEDDGNNSEDEDELFDEEGGEGTAGKDSGAGVSSWRRALMRTRI
jgi:hypothetical protein